MLLYSGLLSSLESYIWLNATDQSTEGWWSWYGSYSNPPAEQDQRITTDSYLGTYSNWASHSALDAESGGDDLDAAVMITSDQYYDSVGQWMPANAGAYPQAYIIEYNGISEK